jgi:hypothetical protein
MLLRYLPLITGLLPIVAIHLSLLIAIEAGVIPACNPYFEGCTSISAIGRYVPASYLFKPAMMAEAVVMVIYWLFSISWLRSLYAQAQMRAGIGTVAGVLGIVGSLFLMVYITLLGSQEPFYEFMRRFGIYVYFAGSILAQLILAIRLQTVSQALGLTYLNGIARLQIGIALVPFVLGILNLLLKALLADSDPAENMIEWIFALLMQCYFVLTFFAWRDTEFHTRFIIRSH